MFKNDSYEYESEELDEEKEENRKKIVKGIFFGILVIVAVIIILLLLKGCGKSNVDRYDDLVKAAKEYYKNYADKLPESYGDQVTVTLKDLKSENLLKYPDSFSDCADASTYVKVSKLESGNYQYTPVLNCTSEETTFGGCVTGKESDLEVDSSNVEFSFIASRLEKGTKVYYPNKETDINKVKEYYKTAPNSEYSLTDDKGSIGYKYYKEVSGGTSYWNNGAYSATAPSGYPNKGNSKNITYYRKQVVAKWRFVCKDSRLPGQKVLSTVYCPNRNTGSFLEVDTSQGTNGIVATCDGHTVVQDGTVCENWSNWTTTVCKESKKNSADYRFNGIRCQSKTVTAYQWYKNTKSYRSYYPSNKTSASDENTYYLSAPASGYIKDESTKATVYRFYKLEKDDKMPSTSSEWVKVNKEALKKNEMLKSLEELEYDVKSLKDIEDNEELKVEVIFKYCNRK